MLAKRWGTHGDAEAAQKLITSHLRLVAKIAVGYRGYGLPVSDLIAEGNLGLMQAVRRYDPERGFRLATYAVWWIRAAIQEYVLRSWSLVKIGTTSAQKKLFFNLKAAKRQIAASSEHAYLTSKDSAQLSEMLGVSQSEVESMDQRLTGQDYSLNQSRGEEGGGQWQDWLEDGSDSQETLLLKRDELSYRRKLLTQALETLNDRERKILESRRLRDKPKTFEELSQDFGVSRERIRQIEARAFEKLRGAMRTALSDQSKEEHINI